MTPTQLRAFACVVRLGSVKAAAGELNVSEAAVSMHVGQLRKEFDDPLFTRSATGLELTPGGLRLAGRAAEMLRLQDRMASEVSQAGLGKRVLRLATSNLFAEHAAPGLIDAFAGTSQDLVIELSVRPAEHFHPLLVGRTVDVAIGPAPARPVPGMVHHPFLTYEIVTVARPGHPFAGSTISLDQARRQIWHLGPSSTGAQGIVPTLLRRLRVPEQNQRIFQSDAAALEQAVRTDALALAVRFAVVDDLEAGRLVTVDGPGLRAQGTWAAMTLPEPNQTQVSAELLRFVTTPRASHAMIRGAGVNPGRFRPTMHVTLWG